MDPTTTEASLLAEIKKIQYRAKWSNVPADGNKLFETWKKVPVRLITFPEGCNRMKMEPEFAFILAVDAAPAQGGGLFFDPRTKTGIAYRVQFLADLDLPVDDDPTIFEMLNFLYALFLFKTKLCNIKCLRLLTDHNKIRNPKNSVLVTTIYKILDWLKTERKIIIVNDSDVNLNYNLKIRDEDKQFLKYADCLSKDKIFQKEAYPDFENFFIYELTKDVVRRFYGYF